MSEKKKLALHWKILIAIGLGVVWSLFVGGLFGGMQDGKVEANNITTFRQDSVLVNITLPVDDYKRVKFMDQDGEFLFVDGLKNEGKSASVTLTSIEKPITKVEYSYKSNFLSWFVGFTGDWISPWGTIFINLLKFIAIPLVLFSIIAGVANLSDISSLGKLGGKTIGMYLLTTVTSVTLGLLIVNAIAPGATKDSQSATENRISYELWATDSGVEIKDDIRLANDPENKAILQKVVKQNSKVDAGQKAKLDKLKATASSTGSSGPLAPLVDMVPSNIFKSLMDNGAMLQIIFFAIFFGVALAMLPKEKVGTVISFVDGANEVFIRMVEMVMKAAPFFVFCLMAGVMSKMADTPQEMLAIFAKLGYYSLCVVGGLLIMIFGFYPLILRLFGPRIGYKKFFQAISPAQFLAFSTSSSAATLPVTIECVEDNLKVPKKITSFVLPIGATVNMDGTSLYQAIAVIFLAQWHGVDLTIVQQLGIVVTATLASIGSAAVPSAGLVMLMMVLTSVGLNPEWIAIIFPVDRILDMCRTVVNVTSDSTVATIMAKKEMRLEAAEL